jgi:multidrug resistance efflux pump
MKKLVNFWPILLLVVLVVAALIYLSVVSGTPVHGNLKASGAVEGVDVIIAPESAGRVIEVLAQEGDKVEAGQPLLRLDDELLQKQRAMAVAEQETARATLNQARAAFNTAQAAMTVTRAAADKAQIQYDLELAAARLEERPTRTAVWSAASPTEFDQPAWYFQKSEELTAAENEVSAALKALNEEETNLQTVLKDSSNADFVAAENRLADARAGFQVARVVLDKANAQSDAALKDAAQKQYDAASSELDAAQSASDRLLTEQAAGDVLEARARVAVARERYAAAQDHLSALQTGEASLRAQLAAAGLNQAQAGVEQAAAQVEQAKAQITQAEKAVAQTQARLELLDLQIDRLTVRAAVSGIVLTRNVEPGELVQPGTTVMTVVQLDHLTITVYVPEDRYGQIKPGQTAQVTADPFPGQTFKATVIEIADRAEYTPRNVQTADGRRTTVFAVKLTVENTHNDLKPGMPADVTFDPVEAQP